MHAEELPDFSFIEINGLDCFRTVIHAEELPRCTLKNSREISGKISQAIDLRDDFPFLVFCEPITQLLLPIKAGTGELSKILATCLEISE